MINKLFSDISSKINGILFNGVDELTCETSKTKIKIFFFITDNVTELLFSYEQENTNNGYKSVIFYQDELYKKYDLVLYTSLLNLGYNNNIVINANDCHITEIYGMVKDAFIENNHFEDSPNVSFAYGAHYNDELVAIMTFFTKNNCGGSNSFTLQRFCVLQGFTVDGIDKLMMDFFIKHNQVAEISYFIDKRLEGKLEDHFTTKLDFAFIKEKYITYDYYDNEGNRFSKSGFPKDRIKRLHPEVYNEKRTDSEMMISAGYKRIHTLGKIHVNYLTNACNTQMSAKNIIYLIKNTIDGKVYVGQTIRELRLRYTEYLGGSGNDYLVNAFEFHGFHNFAFSVLEYCSDVDHLNEMEIYWIDFYNSRDKNFGYNIEKGGRNKTPSAETRAKMSESGKKRTHTPEHNAKKGRKGAAHHCTGVAKTKEYKANHIIACAHLGDERRGVPRPFIGNTAHTRSKMKPVAKYNVLTKIIVSVYQSIGDAYRVNKISECKVRYHCMGKVKTHTETYSYKFITKEEYNTFRALQLKYNTYKPKNRSSIDLFKFNSPDIEYFLIS